MVEIDRNKLEGQVAVLREEERKRQGIEVAVENGWWSGSLIRNEEEALESGDLVEVPLDSLNYCLIGVLRRKEEPRSLNPQALSLLNKIGDRWKEEVLKLVPGASEIRLSVSSLFRTLEWQAERIEKGLNAAEISPHQSGAAIDLDPNGYYLGRERQAIDRKRPGFDGTCMDILRGVLNSLETSGECHVIWEKGYKIESGEIVKYDACWHVCVSPDFSE